MARLINWFHRKDCNNCDPDIKCAGNKHEAGCARYRVPNSGFMLAELALCNPTGLNEALRQLPFSVRLDFYLK